jgi:hypothetical protein
MIKQVLTLTLVIAGTFAAAKGFAEERPIARLAGAKVATAPLTRSKKQAGSRGDDAIADAAPPRRPKTGPPVEAVMTKAQGQVFDVRHLPPGRPVRRERPEREVPIFPRPLEMPNTVQTKVPGAIPFLPRVNVAPAPAPTASFAGLDFNTWGAGHPPDTNGDVGPLYYIQTINTAIGIYNKTNGVQVAAFTFDTLMSQGNFGNLCDTDNFGDPVVLYDSFEDRWVITDFAFQLDGLQNVVTPPGAFQCVAVSMSGDPVSGGWNFYSINTAGGLGDYPKLGIWPDGLYMSVNMFDYAASGSFQNVRLYAFNKAQMYAGAPTVKVVSFDLPSDQFTVLPANARVQTGTPPSGTPNYATSAGLFLNAVETFKFHVDWDRIALSSVTGPFDSLTTLWWQQFLRTNLTTTAPTPASDLDTLYSRTMVQNQYSNIGGVESLWMAQTAGAGNPTSLVAASTQSAVRYYQVGVTGGSVAASATQGFTYSPDLSLYRYVPSVAVDRAGDMAIGYSTSNASTNPAIAYAGRLAADPVNTITQTEQLLIAGTGSQSGISRWGDYSAMTLDPNGCTFWFTSEYYLTTGFNHQTRIGSFAFPSCAPVGAGGAVSGTVRKASDNSLIPGATVKFGARTATTNGSGAYSFPAVPAGTYPSIIASFAGFNSSTTTTVNVADSVTTTENFLLSAASAASCSTDTSQSDFQTGVPTNVDLNAAAGSLVLSSVQVIDQQNTSVTNNGFGFSDTQWAGQTFQAAVSGPLTKVDLDLFCSGCTGTPPNITVSIRATSGGVPTGADLAVATIPGFTSGSGGYMTATFASPATVTTGTTYAVIFRAAATYPTGTFAYVCSCSSPDSSPYANGARVTSANSGTVWTADVFVAGGRDLGFRVFVNTGYASSGDFISPPKDSNPGAGFGATWSTLTWNGSTPAGTTLKFQVAGSNSANGPFNFVGPNGTSATFFAASPAPLASFNGFRYLEYRAFLSTTNSAATPSLNDVAVCFADVAGMVPPAPTSVVATGGAGPSVTITWLTSAGATSYKVYRRAAGTGFVLAGTTSLLQLTDSTGLAVDRAYLYVVHAVSGGLESGDSVADLATTVIFAEPITPNVTTVKASHFGELRTAVNAVRDLAGIGTFSFTDGSLTNVAVKSIHIDELRTNLNLALGALHLPIITFADPTLIPGTTPIAAVHVTQLRAGVQ